MSELAPWRERSGQAFVTDRRLLTLLAERGPTQPAGLTDDRRRENVLRLQCRYLSRVDLVSTVAHDVFDLADTGRAFLDGTTELPTDDENVVLERALPLPERRLSPVPITPRVLKERNRRFLNDGRQPYTYVGGDRATTEQQIRNVRNASLQRLVEEFPWGEPLAQQCAHWMRAMVGIHPFPDASHRTGMATTELLLLADGYDWLAERLPGADIDRAVTKSKLLRILHADVTFDTLWARDELYTHWYRYFRSVFSGDGDTTIGSPSQRSPSKPSNETLEQILERTREILSN